MENEIVHTAMLGTGKKGIDINSLAPEITEAATPIQQQSLDTEDQYLQIAALAFNYRQCGIAALPKQSMAIEKALPETLPYCSTQSTQLLNNILDTDSISLLQLWLDACINHQQIVQPDAIPNLLEKAVRHKTIRTAVATCCGNRGQWLSNYNNAWKFGSTTTDEEIWQTGTLEQRVQVIQQVRMHHPSVALQWLQQTWPQEDAATKTELLPILENNIGKEDIPFLENLTNEKSKKVKEIATELLCLIPESQIVQLYWQVLRETIQLKKERALLGLSTKTKLVVQLPETIDEQVFKSGIEKLSKDAKKWSDEQYILQQIVSRVPPHYWEEYFAEDQETTLSLFLKDDNTKFLIEALGKAAIKFKNIQWLIAIIKADNYNYLYKAALPWLPVVEQEKYAMQLLSQDGNTPHAVIPSLLTFPTEWSLPLTRKILPVMMNDPWTYNDNFFNQHIHLVPIAIVPELNTWKPNAEWHQQYWNNTIQTITKLLELKQQISQSFT
jgi:hypothetical protein